MRNLKPAKAAMVMGLLLFFAGCFHSAPSKFYRLSPIEDEAAATKSRGSLVLGVGPVSIPGYLDQPQIAVRLGENSLSYSEYHRWAEGLKQNLAWTISENLAGLLGTEQVYTFPWDQSGPVDYQVTIDVIRFEGTQQGQAEFTARWRVLDRSGRIVVPMRRSSFVEVAASNTYPEWVAALSKAAADLSSEIAAAVLKARGKRRPPDGKEPHKGHRNG